MQIVYAVHLALPPASDGSSLDTAAAAVSAWVARRFGVEMSPLSGGISETSRARVEWSSMQGPTDGLIGAFIDQVDQNDPGWRWRTYIDLGVENGEAWVRVRVALRSPEEGRLTNPRVIAGRPGVVRALADQLPITQDGWRLGEWRTVSEHQVDQYVDFLRDPHRQLPVVTLSTGSSGETFLDPAQLTDRLLGLAHVVSIDVPAAYRVTDRLGRAVSCFNGAVRMYWPGFQEEDDPYFHRLFMGGTLTFLGVEGLERELFEILGRLAGIGIEEPTLRRRLKIEQRTAELDAIVARRLEANEKFIESAKAQAGDDAAFEQLVVEFDEMFSDMQSKVSELELEGLDAEFEIAELRQERDDAREQLVQVIREFATTKPNQDIEVPAEQPKTILEAVQLADARSEHTVYLSEAFSSAEQSKFEDASRVAGDLETIERVAREWASGDLPSGPNAEFRKLGYFRDGISQTASQQYGSDYEREYDGKSIVLGPHLSHGIGSVSAILRIYMYFDTESHQIVVGHVGRKLRDASNRN